MLVVWLICFTCFVCFGLLVLLGWDWFVCCFCLIAGYLFVEGVLWVLELINILLLICGLMRLFFYLWVF